MRLIDIQCPSCGANMKANSELKKAVCNFCGHEILIDDEKIDISISNGEQFGYEQELGRQKARDERNKKYQKHLEYTKMKLALQYLIDQKSASVLAGWTGYFYSAIIIFVWIILASALPGARITLALIFLITLGICIYITFNTNKKIKKMKSDLANNNLMDYMNEISNVKDKESIVKKAEALVRKDFGEM